MGLTYQFVDNVEEVKLFVIKKNSNLSEDDQTKKLFMYTMLDQFKDV